MSQLLNATHFMAHWYDKERPAISAWEIGLASVALQLEDRRYIVARGDQ